jgi:hypothetical protein
MANAPKTDERHSATHLSRREVLKLGAAAVALAAGGLGAGRLFLPETDQTLLRVGDMPGDDMTHFVVDIPGAAEASAAIREVAVDGLTIDALGTRPASARLTVPAATDAAEELASWFEQTRNGQASSKTITVTVFKPDRTEAVSYCLVDCLPTDWTEVAGSAHTLTVRVGRIEFNV